MIRLSAFILSFLLTSQLIAERVTNGDLIGNGGDVLVLYDQNGEIIKIEAFDHYEAREYYSLVLKIPEGDPIGIVKQMIDRIKLLDPTRHKLYFDWAERFYKEAKIMSNITLSDIPDSSHVYLPDGYKIEQLIVQREPIVSTAPRYTIDADLWNRLDAKQQAMMILHELIYRDAIAKGHKNSIAARYFNAMIAAGQISQNIVEYNDLLKSIGFFNKKTCKKFEETQTKICLDDTNIEQSNRTWSGYLSEVTIIKTHVEEIYDFTLARTRIITGEANFVGLVTIDHKGYVMKGTLAQDASLAVKYVLDFNTERYRMVYQSFKAGQLIEFRDHMAVAINNR